MAYIIEWNTELVKTRFLVQRDGEVDWWGGLKLL